MTRDYHGLDVQDRSLLEGVGSPFQLFLREHIVNVLESSGRPFFGFLQDCFETEVAIALHHGVHLGNALVHREL
jgi:hypothetical protein